MQEAHPELKDDYLIYKRQHQDLLKSSKRDYFDRCINNSSNKSASMWKIIKKFYSSTGNKSGSIMRVEALGGREPDEIANEFNNYFQSAPAEVVASIPEIPLENKILANTETMFLSPVTDSEVVTIVSRLKNKYSAGPDDLAPVIIKEFGGYLAEILTYLINLSFERGVFPEMLKISSIVPVYKRGPTDDPGNYRPVALGSVIAKVLEYAMADRLDSFLNKHKIIADSQHGFRKSKSTSTALVEFYIQLLRSIERRQTPIGIFCDLKKAFDCVHHGKLLSKIYSYGIRGNAGRWIASYLQGRTQYVQLKLLDASNNLRVGRSHCLPMDLGVPQGSVLGPKLFTMYINDIVYFLADIHTTLYADDISVLVTGAEDLQERSNGILGVLSDWFAHNKLSVSMEKTKYILFHNRQRVVPEINLKLKDEEMQAADGIKFLGTYIDQNFNWKEHCNRLSSLISSRSFLFRMLRSSLSLHTLKAAYFAEVQSRLQYGLLMWGSSSAAQEVFMAQKRVIRCMVGARYKDTCRPIFRELGILTLPCLFILEIALYIYKRKMQFLERSSIHSHNTRNKVDLNRPQCSFLSTSLGPENLGLRIFNKLPTEVRECVTVNSFKMVLKEYLLQKGFYNINDYLLQ